MFLIIHSTFIYETTFNPEFVFGAIWMLFSITQVQFYNFKSKMEDKNA